MNQKSDAPDWSSYKLGWEDGVMAERQSHRQTHLHTAPVDAVNTSQERVDETAERKHMTDLATVGEVGVWGKREWFDCTDEQLIAEVRRRGFVIRDAQIEQSEQEPVLWLKTWSDGSVSVLKTKSHAFADRELEPLYSAPPPRQPLTDEEIRAVYGDDLQYRDGDYMRFARAIEAAHGIGEKA